ncbi:FHA domain-containing protein [Nostoc sp. XA010]|uniref:FHA domain-containing protein n=1 Tax=Nostoc sp. XA010 TaxID=2780407 RepID=UPI001E321AA4|nr:FHA domain-containing protein [Nostoc sp. XA010]MCC5659012.1 FHA domain-containing protein [Nostoc sp. XA010]
MKVKVFNSQTLSEVKELNLALATRTQRECIVGRSPNAGLVIDSPDVSRLHGKFFYQDGDYYFYDLGSRNGSIVNGYLAQTNQSYKLKAGDVIRIGEFVLTIEEINSVPEDLPETVYKSLDATVFSGLREAANLDIYKIPNQPQEAVNEVSESVIAEKVTETSNQDVQSINATTDTSDVINFQETTNFQEVTFVQSQEAESQVIAKTPETISEVFEITYIQSPKLSEELTVSQLSTETAQVTEEPTVPEVSTEAAQLTGEPTVSEVSTETSQLTEEPTVSEGSTEIYQATEEPTVSEVSTETYQATGEPTVSEVITETSQLTEEPTVSEVITETSQLTEEPTVSEVSTETSQLTEEPTVSEGSTETYQATEEPTVSEVITQTSQLTEEATVSEGSTETYQATEEPTVSEVITQTSQLTEELTAFEVITETYQATEEPTVSEVITETSQLTEEPTVSEVSTETSQLTEEPTVSEGSTETYQATEEPTVSEVITQTSQLTEEATVSEGSTETYQATEEPTVSEVITQTSQLTEELTAFEVITETYQATEEPTVSEVITQTSQLTEEPTVSEVSTETAQPAEELTVFENTSSIPEVISDLTTIETPEIVGEVSKEMTPTPAEDTYLQAVEALKTTEYVDAIALPEKDAVSQVTDISTIDLGMTALEEVSEPSQTSVEVKSERETSQLREIQPAEVEVVEDVAVYTQVPAEESKTEAVTQKSNVESPNLASLQTPVNETPKVSSIIYTKYIALIAHESKKSDLAKFVAQHQEFFSQCLTLAPPSISQILIQQLNISISLQISATTSGGYQTIASMVASEDILAVILLKDFMMAQSSQANEEALLRVCNINEVLVATNIPTAEAIIHYIQFKA